ncbi:MAG: type II toxin-antitoxin system VapC family toxin [Mariprofundus sp.]
MILVDTSVWVDHLRKRESALERLLGAGMVLIHPFVIGELACGNMKHRETILPLLKSLPMAKVAIDDEVLLYIEKNALMGRGIGYIDVHLLTAVALTGATGLWTRDKRLHSVAALLGKVWME